MASLTIRNLDDSLKADLRLRAAQHGRSMEEEARQILRQTLAPTTPAGSLAKRIHSRFAGLDAENLPGDEPAIAVEERRVPQAVVLVLLLNLDGVPDRCRDSRP